MQIERVSFKEAPERITETTWDCIWVFLRDRQAPSPLEKATLEWLDWKLQGQLSRVLLESASQNKETVFVPTMNRLATPYLALELAEWDAARFVRNCEGMKLRNVAVVCEAPESETEVEQKLKQLKAASFPERVQVLSGEGSSLA